MCFIPILKLCTATSFHLRPSVSQSHMQRVFVQQLPLIWKGIAILICVSRNVTVETIYNHGVTPITHSGFSFHKAAPKLHALKLTPSVCAKRRFLPPSLPASCVRPVQGPLEGRAPRPGDGRAFWEGRVFLHKDGFSPEVPLENFWWTEWFTSLCRCLASSSSPRWVLSYSPLMF